MNESQLVPSNGSKGHFIAVDDTNTVGANNTQYYANILSSSSPDPLGDLDSQASALKYNNCANYPAAGTQVSGPLIMHKAQIANIMSANRPLLANPSQQSNIRRNDNQQIVCSN